MSDAEKATPPLPPLSRSPARARRVLSGVSEIETRRPLHGRVQPPVWPLGNHPAPPASVTDFRAR
eukprot:2863443-Pyramimonas_sp.AAC.1